MLLNPEEISAIHKIETYWQTYGRFQAPEGFNIREAIKKPAFIRALENRGIALPSTSEGFSLSEKQLAAITTVADFTNKKSIRSKLSSLGITMTEWQGWLRDEKFKEVLHKITSSTFEDSLHIAQTGLVQSMERGDVSAIKYYMEITGRYRESDLNAQNVKLMITRLIEAIQYRVKDPETMKALANDFNLIFDGKEPNYSVKQIEGVI